MLLAVRPCGGLILVEREAVSKALASLDCGSSSHIALGSEHWAGPPQRRLATELRTAPPGPGVEPGALTSMLAGRRREQSRDLIA